MAPSSQPAPQPIGGWLWAVVAWLGMTLLSATAMLLVYLWFLIKHAGALTPAGIASLMTSGAMWLFTFRLLRLLFRRSRRFPRLLILWLLVDVLLGIKTFAFAPISDNLALAGTVPARPGRGGAGALYQALPARASNSYPYPSRYRRPRA